MSKKKLEDKFTRIPPDAHRFAMAEAARCNLPLRVILRAAVRTFMAMPMEQRTSAALEDRR
jgi:hypothetical protein